MTPFQEKPLIAQGFFRRLFGKPVPKNAYIALENLLAHNNCAGVWGRAWIFKQIVINNCRFTSEPFLGIMPRMETAAQLSTVTTASSRAWYSASVAEFLQSQPTTIIGRLTTNCDFALLSMQTDAWLAQIAFLQKQLISLTGSLFFEFNIPRMGRRIDAVLLVREAVGVRFSY